MTDEYALQPPISSWKFVDELQAPLHTPIAWRRAAPGRREADLRRGVSFACRFPDPEGRLETAVADFRDFLAAGSIPQAGGYSIVADRAPTSCFEAYRIEACAAGCRVLAADTEGIRRGLVFLEDTILSSGGPFLPFTKIARKPFIKTRISRCFFGPIKRPPLNRDELMDGVNYYPDNYLNRLAHEGINGLWLSVEFRDLCPSRFFPGHGRDSGRRLAKLRQTVARCARYGIRIFVFCNEPLAFGTAHYTLPLAELKGRPEFAGHRTPNGWTCFCTSSQEGQAYLEECTGYLFEQVPGLGGMIAIVHGERPTNCYSYDGFFAGNTCPRCSRRKPWDVYRDTLSTLSHGMHKAAPQAEFIAWLYTPAIRSDDRLSAREKRETLRRIAGRAPRDVTVQVNFESNGAVRQLGRTYTAYDYWLAWPGPSRFFAGCAAAARKAGAGVSAKIQVGCSHENATIPFMPVPGNLYRKYRAMRDLGVRSVMQCWYFGNYPGLMNKAAGELSFRPFPKSERAFLESLARVDWPGNPKTVARAWSYFREGYSQFPIALSFTWFGPLHCSIVWPLHLEPVDQPIAPSWTFGWPDSGDRIGECIGFEHSLDEVLRLLKGMDENWQKGLALLAPLEAELGKNRDRQRDLGLYRAIGLQIRSAYNVFRFYELRERLPFCRPVRQREMLALMAGLVREERAGSRAMKRLCLRDPRLGFHSEAEGYKFFPAKLERRVRRLNRLLAREFPQVASDIRARRPLFAAYSGLAPEGKRYDLVAGAAMAEPAPFEVGKGSWKAWRRGRQITFEIEWAPSGAADDRIIVEIEPRRLWPALSFELYADGRRSRPENQFRSARRWTGATTRDGKTTVSRIAIPFAAIPWYDGRKPIRVNIHQTDAARRVRAAWIPRHSLKPRLIFSDHNSADLGWLCPAPAAKR